MNDKITPAQHIAAIAGLSLTCRRTIPAGDQMEFIDSLKEIFAIIGGAALLLADDMDIRGDVDALIDEGQGRVAAFIACQGLEGTA